jgi:serine/threonine-protein kinase
MGGARIRFLGFYPGREGDGLGIHLDPAGARVARIIHLPGSMAGAEPRLSDAVARAADTLQHPHIQATLGLLEKDGQLSLAVQHAEGETLAEILAVGGRLPTEVAARIVRDACLAVHFAHEEGQDGGPILHGWLRASNVVVGRSGVTLVAGFGVGQDLPSAELLPWQSPEQILNGPGATTRRTDVHGLGLLLHASLSGANPFAHLRRPEEAILFGRTPALEPLGVPRALAAVARRSLSVNHSDRHDDALALARAIEAAVPDVADPAEVAAWSESLFPARTGMRLARRRALDAALARVRRREIPCPDPLEALEIDVVPSDPWPPFTSGRGAGGAATRRPARRPGWPGTTSDPRAARPASGRSPPPPAPASGAREDRIAEAG